MRLFLGRYIKDNYCCDGNPNTVTDLVAVIKKVVGDKKADMLENVFMGFR